MTCNAGQHSGCSNRRALRNGDQRMLKARWQKIAAVVLPAYVIALWSYAVPSAWNIVWNIVWNIGKALDHWSALITAIATALIAYFTKTIWDINRSQLQHGRQVERAYISAGGLRRFLPQPVAPLY